jgi:hypothetical protein
MDRLTDYITMDRVTNTGMGFYVSDDDHHIGYFYELSEAKECAKEQILLESSSGEVFVTDGSGFPVYRITKSLGGVLTFWTIPTEEG